MKNFIVFIVLSLLMAIEAQAQHCYYGRFWRPPEPQDVVEMPQPVTPQGHTKKNGSVETLSEADAVARQICLPEQVSLVDEIIENEAAYAELATPHHRSISEVFFRLRVASKIANRHENAVLERCFAAEAEIVSVFSHANVVSDIWLSNAERQVANLVETEEPYATFLKDFSPSYAKLISGKDWRDTVAFGNFKLLAEGVTAESSYDVLDWAAFRLIPTGDFHGERTGLPPSAIFTTVDRFELREFISCYSNKR